MRSLPAALAAELQADGHGDIARLVEIELPTGTIYRTDWNVDLTFQPDGDSAAHTYVSDILEWDEIRASIMQESPRVDLRIQNVTHPSTGASRPWSTLLASLTAATALNGLSLAWRIVSVALLGTGTAQVHEENWALNRPRLEDNDALLEAGPPHDIYRLLTPWPPLRRPRCLFTYKDTDCKSASALATCDKSLSACMVRHTESRARISQIPYNDARLTRVR